jgi:hypothetical protein
MARRNRGNIKVLQFAFAMSEQSKIKKAMDTNGKDGGNTKQEWTENPINTARCLVDDPKVGCGRRRKKRKEPFLAPFPLWSSHHFSLSPLRSVDIIPMPVIPKMPKLHTTHPCFAYHPFSPPSFLFPEYKKIFIPKPAVQIRTFVIAPKTPPPHVAQWPLP